VFLGHSVTQRKNVSDATAKVIDEEIRRVIDEAEQDRPEILTARLDETACAGQGAARIRDDVGRRRSAASSKGERIARGSPAGPTTDEVRPGRRSSVPPSGVRVVSSPSRSPAPDKGWPTNPFGGAGWLGAFRHGRNPRDRQPLADDAGDGAAGGDGRRRMLLQWRAQTSGRHRQGYAAIRYMLEPALTAALSRWAWTWCWSVRSPTPAIAMLTRSLRADLGVVLSASHNPYGDNGIKLFDRDGYKLSDELELKIETHLRMDRAARRPRRARPGSSASMTPAGRYIESSSKLSPRIAARWSTYRPVDCAHGAAYKVAPTVFWELGARCSRSAYRPMV